MEKQKRVHAAGGLRIHHEVKADTPEYTAATRQWETVRLPRWVREQSLLPRKPKAVKKPRVKTKSESVKGSQADAVAEKTSSQAAAAPKKITSIKLIVTKPRTLTLKLRDPKRPREEEDEDEEDGQDGDKGSPTKKKKPDSAPKK